jgi:cytochrome c-type biogenesis protein
VIAAASVGDVILSGDVFVAIGLSFVAGLLAFLSPCVLPLIPGYIAYVGGFTLTNTPTRADRRRVLAGILGFVAGFGVVFVTVSVLFGALGFVIAPHIDLVLRIAGVVLIVMGVIFAGGIPALQRDLLPAWRTRTGVWGAPFLGVVFALGWVPCVGPTLVAVQTLALESHSLARAALLGVAYWAGLALPFVLVALLLGRIAPALGWVKRHIRAINVTGGVLLVFIGALMTLGFWRAFMSWVGVTFIGFTPAL